MCHGQAYYHHGCGPRGRYRSQHKAAKFQRWAQAFAAQRGGYPPVNIKEHDDRFELTLFAPGFKKKDFRLSLVDKVLSISVEAKKGAEKQEQDHSRWRRQEFGSGGFKRRFELSDQIDTAAIQASYAEGILTLTLPKTEGSETIRQDIDIS